MKYTYVFPHKWKGLCDSAFPKGRRNFTPFMNIKTHSNQMFHETKGAILRDRLKLRL